MMGLILFLIIGGVAGWLAGLIMKGRGFGALANIGIGIVGSVIGGFVFRLLGLASQSMIGELVTATAGAVLLLFIVGKLKKA
ncbi:GlsB/YeaQ/YmgE family stress response membrane protein [Marinobacter zhejiangensis]|uniref:Transglycosylase associated protein n=1 Tax=Marinobacter zhejiangensis TaxID=488535 RepID=A0A1I4L9H7_9GAMM|nr:GlsB/YeaQ/YmgE family stress response membrane protein [Marinobacter zhejiangensis]SFL87453.1 Transglycosylase associated protein [Marinobacter zhejiangensis]